MLIFDIVSLLKFGPKGLEFARYSLDYHTIRNYLHVNRAWGKQRYAKPNSCMSKMKCVLSVFLILFVVECRADRHMPSYAKKIVSMYNKNGEIDQMLLSK